MVIDINTDNLINSGLSPNQYLISNLIYQRSYNTFINFKLYFPQIVENEIKELINKEFIIEDTSRIGYSITNKFLEYVIEADFFNELLNKFPIYVIRNGNSKDYLRTDKTRCRKKYCKLTKNKKSIHTYIMKCLDFELATRQSEGTLPFMKRLPNWLDCKEWEPWAERMEHETAPINNSTYGTSLE